MFQELSFHDDKELTVSNLYAHHTETRYRTSNGHTRTEHVEVTDFLGQSVLFMSTDQFLWSSSGWFRPKIISLRGR